MQQDAEDDVDIEEGQTSNVSQVLAAASEELCQQTELRVHGMSVKRGGLAVGLLVYKTDPTLQIYEHTNVEMVAASTEESIPEVRNSTRKVGIGVEMPVPVSQTPPIAEPPLQEVGPVDLDMVVQEAQM